MIALTLPQLSISMEEGRVLAWFVDDGAEVRAGQIVVEVETDKATLELESPTGGVLQIVAQPGETLPVDALLAKILAPGDRANGGEESEEVTAPVSGPARPPTAAVSPAEATAVPAQKAGGRVASPAARRRAEDLGVDLSSVEGSGPGGRIVVSDVEHPAASAPARPERPEPPPDLRQSVLENIIRSWREIPHIHIGCELAADGLARAYRQSKTKAERAVTVSDLSHLRGE